MIRESNEHQELYHLDQIKPLYISNSVVPKHIYIRIHEKKKRLKASRKYILDFTTDYKFTPTKPPSIPTAIPAINLLANTNSEMDSWLISIPIPTESKT